ncbi:unnamed protein product [Hymenolepis diminuta]|uniref:AAA domain-containing protein n=1 Tax=Hymenolepis diminuta TaxID=6216 RepID=A0A0R3SJ27_HYMDI|nr:unnamed protein product [Hymenolepis diminuta]
MERFLRGFTNTPVPRKIQSTTKDFIPWVEKYRPKTVDDVAQQAEVVSVLKKCLEGSDLPNLLFYGPPGTGKTSLILALARQLFGSQFSERVLELNASDERGIGIIREKVKNFSKLAVSSGVESDDQRSSSLSLPPYKLIILDEADSMTAPAQAALRRLMETDMKTTRFCLTCNYVTRIIGPISSRCAKFRFKPLESDVARSRLRFIADAENVDVSNETLDDLLILCDGDLRQCINLLQTTLRFASPAEKTQSMKPVTITHEDLNSVATRVPANFEEKFISSVLKRDFDAMRAVLIEFTREGLPASQFLHQLQARILESDNFSNRARKKILREIAEIDLRVIQGAEEYIQFLNLGCQMIKTVA